MRKGGIWFELSGTPVTTIYTAPLMLQSSSLLIDLIASWRTCFCFIHWPSSIIEPRICYLVRRNECMCRLIILPCQFRDLSFVHSVIYVAMNACVVWLFFLVNFEICHLFILLSMSQGMHVLFDYSTLSISRFVVCSFYLINLEMRNERLTSTAKSTLISNG